MPTAPGKPAVPLRQPRAGRARHEPQQGRRMGRACRRRCWVWRSTTGRSTRWPTPSRSARSCWRRGKVRTIADQAVDPPYNGRILLRHGRSSGAFAKRRPADGGEGDAGLAQGGHVGRSEPDRRGPAFGREEVHRGLGGDQRPRDLASSSTCRACRDAGRASRPRRAGDEGGRLAQPIHRPGRAGQEGLARPGRRHPTNGSRA